ncbi:fas apoptotic inhibitory molecule 1 isoform 1-T1 [Alca torda]
MTDLVAVWEVALSDGVHKIEFEHGTTSGKRVVYVDGKEEIRKEWMFKLVGKETFTVGASKTKATINIDAVSGFAYEYTLEINGKSLKKYMENRSKTTNTWILSLGGTDYRVVLEKDTMDVWCNGQKMETAGEFVEDGTETHFSVGHYRSNVGTPGYKADTVIFKRYCPTASILNDCKTTRTNGHSVAFCNATTSINC